MCCFLIGALYQYCKLKLKKHAFLFIYSSIFKGPSAELEFFSSLSLTVGRAVLRKVSTNSFMYICMCVGLRQRRTRSAGSARGICEAGDRDVWTREFVKCFFNYTKEKHLIWPLSLALHPSKIHERRSRCSWCFINALCTGTQLSGSQTLTS